MVFKKNLYWIQGNNLSGVKLEKKRAVGAHSVVFKSFPDYSMIVGFQ